MNVGLLRKIKAYVDNTTSVNPNTRNISRCAFRFYTCMYIFLIGMKVFDPYLGPYGPENASKSISISNWNSMVGPVTPFTLDRCLDKIKGLCFINMYPLSCFHSSHYSSSILSKKAQIKTETENLGIIKFPSVSVKDSSYLKHKHSSITDICLDRSAFLEHLLSEVYLSGTWHYWL